MTHTPLEDVAQIRVHCILSSLVSSSLRLDGSRFIPTQSSSIFFQAGFFSWSDQFIDSIFLNIFAYTVYWTSHNVSHFLLLFSFKGSFQSLTLKAVVMLLTEMAICSAASLVPYLFLLELHMTGHPQEDPLFPFHLAFSSFSWCFRTSWEKIQGLSDA